MNGKVAEIMADYQGRENGGNGGNGWLPLLTVRPQDRNIEVRTYSPWLDSYERDADSEFSRPLTLDLS